MNELLGMRFLRLLSEPSQEVTNEEMQNAYEEFLEHIEKVSNGTDYSVIYRPLTATRIEIASLATAPLYGQGEKCAKKTVCTKGIGYFQCRTGAIEP